MRNYEFPKIKILIFEDEITTQAEATQSLVPTLAATYKESLEQHVETKIYSVDFKKAIEFK